MTSRFRSIQAPPPGLRLAAGAVVALFCSTAVAEQGRPVDARTGFEIPLAGQVPAPPTATAPPPDDPDDACAIVPTAAPAFSLEDVNPSSSTYGTVVDRTATPGQVTVLYFALASCSRCQGDVDDLGSLVQTMGAAWDEVSVRVVALDTAHESLPELADGNDLPILLDTETADVEGRYGAERWYIYLLDRAGQQRIIHYSLDFDDVAELSRLVDEVATLLAEPAP